MVQVIVIASKLLQMLDPEGPSRAGRTQVICGADWRDVERIIVRCLGPRRVSRRLHRPHGISRAVGAVPGHHLQQAV
jgi:hypothetical protein